MFKGVFSKYVTAFMIIMVLSFLVVVVITSTALGRYSGESKQDMMQASSEAAAVHISDMLRLSKKSIFEICEQDIDEYLSLMASNAKDVTLSLCHSDMTALATVGSEDNILLYDREVPSEMLVLLSRGESYTSFGKNEGRFEKISALCASPVFDRDGRVVGAVVAYSRSIMLLDLWQLIFRVVTGAILWVLLAALIAVYFVSEKVVAPLREISFAAKRCAAGHFDVRVSVRGSDEVSEVAQAFNNMAESLDNYDNMRNTFMSDVSHDLRSPMTSISGFIDGILDGVIPPEQHKYYLQIVSSEIKRLSRLVSSLLDLSRIQAGERKFTMGAFDVCELSRRILISFEQKIDAKKLDVEFDVQEDRMNAYADSDAIYQVLYNLCDNAVKFSHEGGKLSIKISRIKGRKLLISVYNEGQGISSEDVAYVFERFYKGDKSRGLNKSGAGLGLFISKTIIDAHNEKIWVESEHGKNCCFRFTLAAE